MLKIEVVDWLVANEARVIEIEKGMVQPEILELQDEFNDQKYEEIQKLLLDEMSKTIGLTFEELNVIISEEEFDKYIEEVLRNGPED